MRGKRPGSHRSAKWLRGRFGASESLSSTLGSGLVWQAVTLASVMNGGLSWCQQSHVEGAS